MYKPIDGQFKDHLFYLFIIQNPLVSIIWMLYAHGVLVVQVVKSNDSVE